MADTTNWLEMGLHKWIIKQLNILGIKNPTSIQQKCIPEILKGKNCVGLAKTGSGKTAAFALPILQCLSEDPYGIYALVLTPTRELAAQISEQFISLGKPIGIKVTLIVGGMDNNKQSSDLTKKPHVVIACPGRLASILRSENDFKTIDFSKIKYLVIDEADATLAPDMAKDVDFIFDQLPSPDKRQTLAFSATIGPSLKQIIDSSKSDLFVYQTEIEKQKTVDQLQQKYILVPPLAVDSFIIYILYERVQGILSKESSLNRTDNLTEEEREDNAFCNLLKTFNQNNTCRQAILFAPTCWQCQIIGTILKKFGFKLVILHSALSQDERNESLSNFRSGLVPLLIATDLASRGLDIPKVDLVINTSVPSCPEDYVHRVGRTARAGRSGQAITLVVPQELERLTVVEQFIGLQLEEEIIENENNKIKPLLKPTLIWRREISHALKNDECGDRIRRRIQLRQQDNKRRKPISNEGQN